MEFTTPIPNTAYPTASREYFRISLALFFWIELLTVTKFHALTQIQQQGHEIRLQFVLNLYKK